MKRKKKANGILIYIRCKVSFKKRQKNRKVAKRENHTFASRKRKSLNFPYIHLSQINLSKFAFKY